MQIKQNLKKQNTVLTDPILSVCSVSVSKERLWHHNLQGNYILNVCSSFLYYFAIEQTLSLNFSNGVQVVTRLLKELL